MLTEEQMYVSLTDGTFVDVLKSHQAYTEQIGRLYEEWLHVLKEFKQLEFEVQMATPTK